MNWDIRIRLWTVLLAEIKSNADIEEGNDVYFSYRGRRFYREPYLH